MSDNLTSLSRLIIAFDGNVRQGNHSGICSALYIPSIACPFPRCRQNMFITVCYFESQSYAHIQGGSEKTQAYTSSVLHKTAIFPTYVNKI
jgi:hypothetical protein